MARVRILLAAEADIEHALGHTLSAFGVHKFEDYVGLIQEALDMLAADPHAGRKRHDIDPAAWTYHIGKRGRRARHLFMYRIVHDETVEVLALAYDAMDLPRRWRSRSSAR
jgi:plasmid stabilization system protein ParE